MGNTNNVLSPTTIPRAQHDAAAAPATPAPTHEGMHRAELGKGEPMKPSPEAIDKLEGGSCIKISAEAAAKHAEAKKAVEDAKADLQAAAAIAGADGVISPEEFEHLENLREAYVQAVGKEYDARPIKARCRELRDAIVANAKRQSYGLVATGIENGATGPKAKAAVDYFYARVALQNVHRLAGSEISEETVSYLAERGRKWVGAIGMSTHPIHPIYPRPPMPLPPWPAKQGEIPFPGRR